MKVLVCGSRDWTNAEAIYDRLESLVPVEPWLEGPTIMHGDARGADKIAADIALDLGLWVEAYPADWERHGKAAGPIRNLQMLDQQPDLVIAFQRNGSRGTQHTIDEARKRGIPVEVYSA